MIITSEADKYVYSLMAHEDVERALPCQEEERPAAELRHPGGHGAGGTRILS